jgi:hypothetical protein
VVLSANKTYHVVFAFNASTRLLELFVNGALDTSWTAGATPLTSTTASLDLGRRHDGTCYLDGVLDEVAIYNYPLSSTQVSQHYLLGSTP